MTAQPRLTRARREAICMAYVMTTRGALPTDLTGTTQSLFEAIMTCSRFGSSTGSRPFQGQLFYSFSLEEAVPDDHLVREIAAVLDLAWVRVELAPYYSSTGRPSIDPELMIRMLIIGY